MIMTIMLVVSVGSFVGTFFMLGKSKHADLKHKTDVDNLQKLVDDNIGLSTQLFRLYSVLQENQALQIKAMEVISKNQSVRKVIT